MPALSVLVSSPDKDNLFVWRPGISRITSGPAALQRKALINITLVSIRTRCWAALRQEG